jgi:YVTN family beta-propeller protein
MVTRAGVAVLSLLLVACGGTTPTAAPGTSTTSPTSSTTPPTSAPATSPAPVNLYAATGADMLAPALRTVPPRVYVPNSNGDTVTVIDPKTFSVLFSYRTGKGPQHVVPSYDLTGLWVNNDGANTLTEIDPMSGRPTRTVAAIEPYNLYWTPDGKYAVVMAEASQQMVFLDAATMKQQFAVKTDCRGLNHLDFSADGRYAVVSCEFSGKVIKVDMIARQQVGALALGAPTNMPQDVRIAPDGSVFYVADMMSGGVWIIDGQAMTQVGFVPTGPGAHGLYFDRSAQRMFVTNRGTTRVYGSAHGPGSVSVVDWANRTVSANWPIPGGGSPDMGNLSPDGRQIWLSGRYDNEMYVLDTTTGRLLSRIPVGASPHGLTYWPQPGRFSLGHTGIMR